jgi:uroporphyrinogen-III synthase
MRAPARAAWEHRKAMQHPRALEAATVVLTRPAGESAGLAAAVRRRGGHAIALATTRLMPRPRDASLMAALAGIRACDAVVFVSAPAVRHALAAGLAPADVRAAIAVGKATARALAAAGISAVTPENRSDSEGVLALPMLAHARRVALVGAPGGRGMIDGSLRARGVEVVDVHVYARAPHAPGHVMLARLDAAAGPLLVLLSSSATLAALAATLAGPRWQRLAGATWVVASARIADAARAAGITRIVVARSALAADLLAAAGEAWRTIGERVR